MTIKGLGLDIVSVERIRRLMERPRFLQKVLTENERAFVKDPEFVAGRWAAKEALFKTGCGAKTFREVEILPGESGKPEVVRPNGNFMVSITHEKQMAAAVVLWLA